MKKKNLSFLSVLVVVTMIVAIFAPIGFVVAPGGQQHNIYGKATSGANPPGSDIAGAEITAWIDGVSYGSNVTSGTYKFDLYVEGDTWGLPLNDSVKDGGWEGDEIMYFLDYAPSDYHLTIANHVSIFNYSAYENFTTGLYFDTNTYSDTILGDTYLRGLKINEICLIPGDTFPQYLYLYDPGGELSEAALEDANKGYYLEKDDTVNNDPHGEIFDFNLNSVYVEPTVGNYYYINLTGFSLDPNGDELKLVWKNPGGSDDNIANGADVIVDRVEWGNHVNNISTTNPPDDREYDNTTLLDCPGSLISGQSFRRNPNGTDTDNCQSDFDPLPRTPRPAGIPPPKSKPGAPTQLRVHRGPWNAIGGPDDLVLSWISPTWNWANLTKNIVYYDTDISNGFQYTSFRIVDPNSTFEGDADWCLLPGYHLDGNDYAFIIHTTGDTVASYENMTGTNVGYKYGITLTSAINRIWVSIPYHSDYDFASDITTDSFPDGEAVTAVERWNYTKQDYDSRLWFGMWVNDFDIEPGDAIHLSINPLGSALPYTWKIVGAHDPDFQFELIENSGPLTDYKMLSLPYHRTYQMASDITAEFPDKTKISVVGHYNYTIPKWEARRYAVVGWFDDFSILPSPTDVVYFYVTSPASYYWTPQVEAF